MRSTIILIRNTHPQNYGGAEIYQLRLAAELKSHNFRPIIISSSIRLINEARNNKIIAFRAPFLKQQNWSGWRNLLLPAYFLWQIRLYFWYRSVFKKYQPAAVDVQSRDDWLAATRAAHKLGVKVLWTDHMDFRSWVLQNVNQKYKNPIAKLILKTAQSQVDDIIFISDYERQYFEKYTKKWELKNLITIKNGAVDREEEFASIKPRPNSLCYVGRLIDYKGINELLAAFKEVHAKYPNAELHIYGDGEAGLIEKAKNAPGVLYHGFTDNPLLAIAESSIFVLPSYREGLSLSLVDAAMLGRAIIASDIDGNPEVVIDQKTGLLVPAKNSQKLAEAIIKLLEDPAFAQKLAKNARNHYEEHFNFSNNINCVIIKLS